ncbi:claudin-2 [Brienomyrus brachyistius]|uniref:claudin-2 n=1 Tax=Brienomyrus brachyistius TaxID=42636 RepID=UPI0020B4268B|nr:claudin-2 [Brienomyrus brachyistius]
MPAMGMELLGFVLGVLGMLGTLVVTLLPHWKTSAFTVNSIVTAVEQKKGLWMECVFQSTGSFQCDPYDSILALPADLQTARAMMVTSNVLSLLGCAAANLGMQCTVCLDGSSGKAKVAGAAGCCFLLAGFLCLIPVSWVTNEVVQTFYQPGLSSVYKDELGECLFVGLAASIVSLLAGVVLCLSCCDASGSGGATRAGSGYPYHARAPRRAPHSMTFHAPSLLKQQARSPDSSSSSGTGRAPKGNPYNTVASYNVTGYV